MGCIVDKDNDDIHAVDNQLAKARLKWGRFGRVLRTTGAPWSVLGYFYKAVVQAVLLYGSETWTTSKFGLRNLHSFHRRSARYITGTHIRQTEEGNWFFPSMPDVLSRASLYTLDEYIAKRKEKVLAWVRRRPIYQHCRGLTGRGGSPNRTVWWRS